MINKTTDISQVNDKNTYINQVTDNKSTISGKAMANKTTDI
jgi:hypothetical protein